MNILCNSILSHIQIAASSFQPYGTLSGVCLRGRVLYIISTRQHNIMALATGITFDWREKATFAIHDRELHWLGLMRQRYATISDGRGSLKQTIPYLQLTVQQFTNTQQSYTLSNWVSPSFIAILESLGWPTSIILHMNHAKGMNINPYPWITYPNSLCSQPTLQIHQNSSTIHLTKWLRTYHNKRISSKSKHTKDHTTAP